MFYQVLPSKTYADGSRIFFTLVVMAIALDSIAKRKKRKCFVGVTRKDKNVSSIYDFNKGFKMRGTSSTHYKNQETNSKFGLKTRNNR
jgi:hypothetical protein